MPRLETKDYSSWGGIAALIGVFITIAGVLVHYGANEANAQSTQDRVIRVELKQKEVDKTIAKMDGAINRIDRNIVRLGVKDGVEVETPKE